MYFILNALLDLTKMAVRTIPFYIIIMGIILRSCFTNLKKDVGHSTVALSIS